MLHFREMRLLKEMSWVMGQLAALQGAAASCACSLADTTLWQFRTETPSSWEWQKNLQNREDFPLLQADVS